MHSLRRLRARPGLTLAVVTMLGLAIGLTAATFTVADALVLTPVPFRDAERLTKVAMFDPHGGRTDVAPAVLAAWRRTPAFDAAEGAVTATSIVETGRGPIVKASARVSPGMFALLGVQPLRGRGFDAADGRAGSDDRVVISELLWQSAFGGDPAIVGQRVSIDGARATVVGIMPAAFHFPEWNTALWMPLDFAAPPPAFADGRPQAFVRIAPGVPLADAMREATSMAGNADAAITPAMRATPLPLARSAGDASYWRALPALAGGVVLVFVVLCANVCSLLLARLTARRHEVRLCAALGASRARLFKEVAIEHALLGVAGVIAGVAIAWLFVSLARVFLPQAFLLRTLHPVDLDPRALLVAAAAGTLATMAAGVLPAWLGTRPDASPSLTAAERTSTETRTSRAVTRSLLTAEIALACTLLVGGGLLLRSFVNLATTDSGVHADGVLLTQILLPAKAFPDRAARMTAAAALEDAMRVLPGVQRIALSYGVPPSGGARLYYDDWRSDASGGRPLNLSVVESYEAGTDFFDLYGIPILQGRAFHPDDPEDRAVVGERLAATLWPGLNPVGHTFGYGKRQFQVIGVAREIRFPSLDANRDVPEFYERLRDARGYFSMNVRCAPQCPAEAVLRKAIADTVPRATVSQVAMIADAYREELARPRATAALASTFAFIAVLAAAGGLFSVLTYAVAGRRREFGIRTAIGASPRQIRGLVYRDAAMVTIGGTILGIAASAASARALAALQYGVRAWDPWSWATVLVLLALTTILACWRPARVASRVDPVELLRAE
jgi:predicted permease